jgi:hypothetical protein
VRLSPELPVTLCDRNRVTLPALKLFAVIYYAGLRPEEAVNIRKHPRDR